MEGIKKVSFDDGDKLNSLKNRFNKKELTSKDINGYLMHKDEEVAKIVNGELNIINERMIPTFFKLGNDLEFWLENRCIDMHRRNSRLVRKMLSIRTTNKIETVLIVHAHTLTDNYWIRLSNEPNLKYKDVQYSNDLLFDTALDGDTSIYDELISNSENVINTPELTLTGSFEKGWKIIDGSWYLIKSGDHLNNSAELIASKLCSELNFSHVPYNKYNSNCVICENFTKDLKYDFEPMFDFTKDDDNLEECYDTVKIINSNFCQDYLNMIFLDALMLNIDRHTNNFGFLRDSDTGEFISLAPIFDNNLALFSTRNKNNTNLNSGNNPMLNKFYIPFLKEKNYIVPKLEYDKLKSIVAYALSEFPTDDYDEEFTTNFIWNTYNHLKKNI